MSAVEEVYGNPRRHSKPILLAALPFVLGSTVLLFLCTFSTPFIKSIFFLQNNRPLGGNARFGVFGWCVSDYCLPKQLGYEWEGAIPAGGKLTTALVLFPVSSVLSLLALLSFLLTISTLRFAIPTFILALLALISSLFAVVFSLAIWLSTKDAFGLNPRASYGPAFWMAIAAAGSWALACIFIFIGGLRHIVRGRTTILAGGGYQATPTIVVEEGGQRSFGSRLGWR